MHFGGKDGWKHGSVWLNEDEYDLIEPVKLTPEILEAAGFEKVENVAGRVEVGATYFKYKSIPEFVLIFQSDGQVKYQWHTFFKDSMRRVTLYKWLHEIQNLTYWLTGFELEINIEKLTGREAGEHDTRSNN